MAISQLLFVCMFPAFFLCLVTISDSSTVSEIHCNEHEHEFQRIKLKIAHLESKIEEVSRSLDEKVLHIEERESLIQQMSQSIHSLKSSLSNLQKVSFDANEKLNALEQEVKFLWASLRKNNFEIHVLKSKAQEAEEKLETVSSEAEKMSNIVNEQWIQIQRLEQALHMIEVNTLRAHVRVDYSRCSFLRFINKLRGTIDPYIKQSIRFVIQIKDYHHQLQRFIKQEMEKNDFTATLANGEFVFFMASALITFPILGAWMFLSSHLR